MFASIDGTMSKSQQLMTLDEVALFLRLSRDTVYRLVQSDKIPALKIGAQWRFDRSDLDTWLKSQKTQLYRGPKKKGAQAQRIRKRVK